MTLSSYRPGTWFGVFGSATTLLLPGSEKSRVAALWARIDDGAGFDAVLDELLKSGLGTLPGFVLVSGDEGPTKVLVRGGVLVTGTAGGEPVRIDGSEALTWVERTLDDVESLRIVVDDLPSADAAEPDSSEPEPATDLPIIGGLVRVSCVDQPAVRAEMAEAAEVAEVAVLPVVPEAAEESSPLEAESDTAQVDAPDGVEPLDIPIDPPDVWARPAPVLDVMSPPAPPVGPPAGPPSGPPVGLPPGLPTPPPIPLGDPATEAMPTPPPVDSVEYSDHDGMTRTGRSEEEFSRELPGIPGQQQAPGVVAPVARLEISNGESIEVDRVVLIGRAPEARRFSSTEQPRLVKVPSPLHEISSTHVEVRPGSGADHGSAVVTDMGSTNGTVIEQPGLGPENLRPGIAVQLIPGATINLGDGVSIRVIRP